MRKRRLLSMDRGAPVGPLLTRPTRRTDMIFLLAGLLAFSNILCVNLNAQVSGGSIFGTLTDTS